MNFEKYVNAALDVLGVPCNLLGRKYLFEAIIAYHNNPQLGFCNIYIQVAEAAGKSPVSVERCIRTCVERVFRSSDIQVLHEFFGNTVYSKKWKPTNSEFISRVEYMYSMRGEE